MAWVHERDMTYVIGALGFIALGAFYVGGWDAVFDWVSRRGASTACSPWTCDACGQSVPHDEVVYDAGMIDAGLYGYHRGCVPAHPEENSTGQRR